MKIDKSKILIASGYALVCTWVTACVVAMGLCLGMAFYLALPYSLFVVALFLACFVCFLVKK